MTSIGNYDEIMSDKKLFDRVVYTPLSKALEILEERRNNKDLVAKVTELLNGDIPECLNTGDKCGVQFRQIATPNMDAQHFLQITKENHIKPIFFEYLDDKFTSNNDFKHSLGQLRINNGVDKKGEYQIQKCTIVDFSKHDGKKLCDVPTIKGESLLSLHRKLFEFAHNDHINNLTFYDLSEWIHKNGGKPEDYYKKLFLMFICNGILFENFLTTGSNAIFSKNIVLPAIDYVYSLTNEKPLIVPIPPMDIEDDEYWVSYKPSIKEII